MPPKWLLALAFQSPLIENTCSVEPPLPTTGMLLKSPGSVGLGNKVIKKAAVGSIRLGQITFTAPLQLIGKRVAAPLTSDVVAGS